MWPFKKKREEAQAYREIKNRAEQDAIRQLETITGKKIEQVEASEIDSKPWAFSLDSDGAVSRLNLFNCKLTDLRPLINLVNLKELYLDINKISDLTPLATLTGLTRLELDRNRITDLTPLFPFISAKNLKILDLSNNQLTHLPPEFLQLEIPVKWEWKSVENGIFLAGNPLESPPVEIVKQGPDAVVSYFNQLKKEQVQLLQCKLLIVGSGEVGKTTLMKKLKDPSLIVKPGLEPTTHGINIIPWELPCTFENCTETQTVK